MVNLFHLIKAVFCNPEENIIISTYYLSGVIFDKVRQECFYQNEVGIQSEDTEITVIMWLWCFRGNTCFSWLDSLSLANSHFP